MKKEEIPQDDGALNKLTKEVCYVVDSSGKYVTGLSSGWEVKKEALDVAWNDIAQRIATARQQVLDGQASPVLFFMEYRLMDITTLAAYTGLWKWQIKKHMKPASFNKLSESKLKKYAEAFNTSPEDLKTMTVHEG
jgi:hypothetical protein